ncbi:MAG: DUF167 domain-containing protein [Anaerolineae bacterium]
MAILSESGSGITLAVKVVPRAKRDEIVGIEGDALKVRLNAPPVEGRANEALIKFLSEVLGVRRADVEILRGETTRNKLVRIRGVSVAHTQERLHLQKTGPN